MYISANDCDQDHNLHCRGPAGQSRCQRYRDLKIEQLDANSVCSGEIQIYGSVILMLKCSKTVPKIALCCGFLLMIDDSNIEFDFST